jgi:hypothetical protein
VVTDLAGVTPAEQQQYLVTREPAGLGRLTGGQRRRQLEVQHGRRHFSLQR